MGGGIYKTGQIVATINSEKITFPENRAKSACFQGATFSAYLLLGGP
jgi:hypothetical protein